MRAGKGQSHRLMRVPTNQRQQSPSSGICMVGAFPPPVHGMAVVNAAVYELVRDRVGAPTVLNLSADSLRRTWSRRLARMGNVAKSLLRYCGEILSGRGATLYVGASGGWGQLYEALFVAVARFAGARIFLHHHSFAYLDQPTIPARLLSRLAGPAATHIVLCEGMQRRLQERYPIVAVTRVVSNAAFVGQGHNKKYRQRAQAANIGFFGNISRAKGILEFLRVAEQLAREATGIQSYVAGPIESRTLDREIREAETRLHTLHYLGPRYGQDKEAFWSLIDVLLFPSRYSNEAAPLVVHEAMAHGVPVIAWERGCLASMVTPDSGFVVKHDQDFVEAAVALLRRWRRDSAAFAQMSNSAAEEFRRQHARSTEHLAALLNDLCSQAAVSTDESASGNEFCTQAPVFTSKTSTP